MRRLIFFVPLLAVILIGCGSKQYEDCSADLIFHDWGVVNTTKSFGEFDSLYYLINPIVNFADTIYYNGNYVDSYYHADSTRVTLRYTLSDSIEFRIERMYAVQINPANLIINVRSENDSTVEGCTLLLKKDANNGQLYRCGPDSAFKHLLLSEGVLHFSGTNSSSSAEAVGSQDYEFRLNVKGFSKAFRMADSLSPLKKKVELMDSLKKDSEKKDNFDKTHREKREKHHKNFNKRR